MEKAKLFFQKAFKRTKAIGLVLVLVMLTGMLCSCNNVNPNVGTDKEETNKNNYTSSTSKVDKSVPEYVNGDDLANRSYELSFLLAQKKFNSPNEIGVNALVQYSFCHLYYDNLIEIPTNGTQLRTATVDEMADEIKKEFGDVTTDIKTSDLYNGAKNCFEMWEPPYGRDIYYDVEVSGQGNDTYKANTTFYTDSTKEEILGRTILTVKDVNQKMVIQRLTSSN